MRVGYQRFKDRFNSKRYKEFKKKNKKRKYLEYQYEALSSYFTKRTDFYYNLDDGLAKLISDLLINYKYLASDLLDMREYDLEKKLNIVIKFFKKYAKTDRLDLMKNPKSMKKYEDNKKKAFDCFREIFGLLWY